MNREQKAFFELCKNGESVLMEELLTLNVIDVNIRNEENMTPLHVAVNYNKPDTVKILLKHGADIDLKDSNGQTALDHSIKKNYMEITELILARGSMAVKPANKNSNWKFSRSKDGKIAQFAFSVSSSTAKEPEFGTLILPFDKFPVISSEPWCSGLLRMSNKPYPYHLIRVSDFADKVKDANLTIALSFCSLTDSSLFLLETRIEREDFTAEARRKFRSIPPLVKPMAEWIVGAAESYSRQMIQDIISGDIYRIIVACDSNMRQSVYTPNGVKETVGPEAHHDREIPIDEAIKPLLKKEFDNWLANMKKTGESRQNFFAAQQELEKLMPLDKDPIFAI